jgi:hypothetical protein
VEDAESFAFVNAVPPPRAALTFGTGGELHHPRLSRAEDAEPHRIGAQLHPRGYRPAKDAEMHHPAVPRRSCRSPAPLER